MPLASKTDGTADAFQHGETAVAFVRYDLATGNEFGTSVDEMGDMATIVDGTAPRCRGKLEPATAKNEEKKYFHNG